jgi:Flp pilus assembly pilin Flp
MRTVRSGGRWLARFREDRAGATAIEYALIAAIVAIFAIAALVSFGDETGDLYGTLADIAATIAASLGRG